MPFRIKKTEVRITHDTSKKQYDSVCIGEKISCERYQSEMTHKGNVHRISPGPETVSSDQ